MLNAGELRDEVMNRGYHHIGAERAMLFVDQAASEVHTEELWPFRRAFAFGVAAGSAAATFPTGTDIKHVRTSSGARRLWPLTESQVRNRPGGGGEPSLGYFVEGGRVVTLSNGGDEPLDIVYYSATPWVNGGERAQDTADTLFVPSQYEYVVIELAVAKAAADDGRDNAPQLRADVKGFLEEMRVGLLRPADEQRVVETTEVW